MEDKIKKAADLLLKSRFTTAFTGAGISVESGIPPFRGNDGLWSKYDPRSLEISWFMQHPQEAWTIIKEIFYDFFEEAKPNKAHLVLAEMEQRALLGRIITQNIDNLHQEAGSKEVYEFHGNSKRIICLGCHRVYPAKDISLAHLPPTCRECGGLLKPDFVFFGESIPQTALGASYEAASLSDVLIIIGTTGEVMPANQIPFMAKSAGSKIIEINTEQSNYTGSIADIFIQGKAGGIMEKLAIELFTTSLDNDQDGINQDLEIHGQ
ncbi:MAG: NAD-dependent deacylase [Bacteroidetes bacterium]|nr:NAD-dependent deacylase [Bacteroidota bacterium]